MNFYSASAIQVPTKTESPSSGDRRGGGGGGAASSGGMMTSSGQNNIRRNSSTSSMGSLDVAATIFSSMQELEASGRNLSSLGDLSGGESGQVEWGASSALESAFVGMGSSALENALGGGMGSSGGMGMGAGGAASGLHPSLNGIMGVGGGGGYHSQFAAAAQRDRLNALAAESYASRSNGTTPLPMEDMLYNNNQMAAGAGDGRSAYSTASIQAQAQALRQLEMEEIMRQHQNQNQNAATSNNHYHEQNQQRTNLLGNLKGGYAPMHSSTSRRGSDNISGAPSISPMQSSTSQHNPNVLDSSLLDTFTPAELLREVSRRQSQRRNSRDMFTGMEQGSSVMDALSRNNSRDDLVDLYNQMRHQGSSTGLRANSLANSLDSFSSLALMARERYQGGAMSGMSAAASAIPLHGVQQREGGAMSAMSALSLPPRSEMNNDASANNASDDPQRQRSGSYSKNDNPTTKPSSSSKSTRDKTSSEESSSDATNSTVVTDTQSPRPSATVIEGGSNENKKLSGKKRRNNSNASFDALLSVFGDELAELDREKNGGSSKTINKHGQMEDDDKSADSIVSGQSVGFFNNLIEKTVSATAVARQMEEEEKNNCSGAMDRKESAVEKDDKRRFSTSSSLSDFPRLSHADETRDTHNISQERHRPAAMNNEMVLSQHMDVLLDRERQRMATTVPSSSREASSFLPINTTFANNGTSPGTSNYTHKIQSTASMMASLEAMRHEELVMRERALREGALRDLQAQRTALGPPSPRDPEMGRLAALLGSGAPPPPNPNSRMAAPPPILPRGGDPKMEHLAALFGGHLPPGVMGSAGAVGPSSVRHSEAAAAANAMLARLQGFPPEYPRPELLPNHTQQVLALPVPHVPVIIEKPPPAIDPNHVSPEVALQRFLDEYGEAAKTSQTDLLGSIAKAEESLASIHAWDRSQGLRKCHSRTVVKTRRSRAKVKAFLMGIDPPKEPQKKRKKTKKKAKAVVDKEIVVSM